MKKIKLSEWAKLNNVCYKTAWTYFKQGRFDGKSEVTDKGSIFVFVQDPVIKEKSEEKVLGLSDIIAAIQNLGEIIKNK